MTDERLAYLLEHNDFIHSSLCPTELYNELLQALKAERELYENYHLLAIVDAERIHELEAEVVRLESPFRKAELKAMEDLEGFRASARHAQLIRRAKAAEAKLRAGHEHAVKIYSLAMMERWEEKFPKVWSCVVELEALLNKAPKP